MRALAFVLLLMALPGIALAQDPPRKLRWARGYHVAIIDADRREWQGRLIEVAKDAIVVEVDSTARRFPLADVSRVDAHGDAVWDGAVRGAVIGGLLAALTIHDAQFAFQTALGWGVMGLGLDALNRCTHTVYRGPAKQAAVTISW
jgi:hypothetical protein